MAIDSFTPYASLDNNSKIQNEPEQEFTQKMEKIKLTLINSRRR